MWQHARTHRRIYEFHSVSLSHGSMHGRTGVYELHSISLSHGSMHAPLASPSSHAHMFRSLVCEGCEMQVRYACCYEIMRCSEKLASACDTSFSPTGKSSFCTRMNRLKTFTPMRMSIHCGKEVSQSVRIRPTLTNMADEDGKAERRV